MVCVSDALKTIKRNREQWRKSGLGSQRDRICGGKKQFVFQNTLSYNYFSINFTITTAYVVRSVPLRKRILNANVDFCRTSSSFGTFIVAGQYGLEHGRRFSVFSERNYYRGDADGQYDLFFFFKKKKKTTLKAAFAFSRPSINYKLTRNKLLFQ